ncbi:signal peptidase II [Faecalibaculum rodentium]|uniref:Lipoprotein signal peptidase n=3 Tax=Faecalibaculum rodentium TaxID=1702221 RepID=A0A140DVC2_9FIRM|nr:signal peptidase II [Faecalibaculum rodentium]AMK54599.1 signal peptidase II [Faecalibaculum rodentium]OLU46043.1 signal peptidase II [Faecalibaculum rodentium]
MKHRTQIYIGSMVLVALMTGLDQWTKWAVSTHMRPGQSIVIIPKLFELTYLQNTGAGFSIFEGYGKPFFAVLTVIAMAVMLWAYIKAKRPGLQMSLALIFAGALGNFIDRMALGYVVDFFHFYIFGWSFPVFNIADICITLGFVFLVIDMLREEHEQRKALEA